MFKFIIILIVSSCLFIACEPSVLFSEPQPHTTKTLKKFPRKIRGYYASISDSTILKITDSSMSRIYDFSFKVLPSSIDSIGIKEVDTLYARIQFNKVDDSIEIKVFYETQLYKLNKHCVLKKYKDFYFINEEYDSNLWEVKKMYLKKKEFIISNLSSDEDLSSFNYNIHTNTDSTETKAYNPTLKQFKDFISQGGFIDEQKYVKITYCKEL